MNKYIQSDIRNGLTSLRVACRNILYALTSEIDEYLICPEFPISIIYECSENVIFEDGRDVITYRNTLISVKRIKEGIKLEVIKKEKYLVSIIHSKEFEIAEDINSFIDTNKEFWDFKNWTIDNISYIKNEEAN